jgi:hypothetical protein
MIVSKTHLLDDKNLKVIEGRILLFSFTYSQSLIYFDVTPSGVLCGIDKDIDRWVEIGLKPYMAVFI